MPIDLTGIAPGARARYVKSGRSYGSQHTLAQARQTLNGLAEHGPRLVKAGFSADDARMLADARDALVAAGVEREAVRTTKKQTNKSVLASRKRAKAARRRLRAIAIRVTEVLEEAGDAPSLDSARRVEAELERTSRSPRDPEALAVQLDGLRALFADERVAAASADRGGPEVVVEAESAAAGLRAVTDSSATVPGTPRDSETLDLIDGIIIHLARAARRAARAVAADEGEPALAALFDLSYLDGTATPDAPAPAAPAPSTPAPASA